MDINGNESRDLLTAQYRARPEPFWAGLQARGDDGYERIEVARRWKWEAIPSWGRDGWDLGDWPLVVIFHRDSADGFELAENCEGDVTAYRLAGGIASVAHSAGLRTRSASADFAVARDSRRQHAP